MDVKIIKNTTLVFLVYIILGGYTINELVMGGTLTKEIKIQVKPIYKEIENKKRDVQLNNKYYQTSHIKYQDIKNAEITDKLNETISENVQPVDANNFDVNLLNDKICETIRNNLSSKFILIVENEPDIIIEVAIEKTSINSLYGPRAIPDIVTYKGRVNGSMVFSREFEQNYKFPFGSIKTPEQIGTILAKRIAKEIKKLQKNRSVSFLLNVLINI